MIKFPTWLYDGILSDREPSQVPLRHQATLSEQAAVVLHVKENDSIIKHSRNLLEH
jgi:hypothetical protein